MNLFSEVLKIKEMNDCCFLLCFR